MKSLTTSTVSLLQLPVCTAQGGSGSFKDKKPIGGWLL